jgi:hypothetical protein
VSSLGRFVAASGQAPQCCITTGRECSKSASKSTSICTNTKMDTLPTTRPPAACPALPAIIITKPTPTPDQRSITIPKRGVIYSLNDARQFDWPDGLRRYIDAIRQGKGQHPKQYSARYICSLGASLLHRLTNLWTNACDGGQGSGGPGSVRKPHGAVQQLSWHRGQGVAARRDLACLPLPRLAAPTPLCARRPRPCTQSRISTGHCCTAAGARATLRSLPSCCWQPAGMALMILPVARFPGRSPQDQLPQQQPCVSIRLLTQRASRTLRVTHPALPPPPSRNWPRCANPRPHLRLVYEGNPLAMLSEQVLVAHRLCWCRQSTSGTPGPVRTLQPPHTAVAAWC